MSDLPADDDEQLGYLLHAEGFQPLPDVNDEGTLIGTILWRLRSGHVEYLALRNSGFALAMRAEARFSYRRPDRHGRVVAYRTGHPLSTLDWLLAAEGWQARPIRAR